MHRPPPVLPPEALRRVCDPSQFDPETPATLPPLTAVLGQPRAVQALVFGTSIASYDFNLFALGLPGSGKSTLIREFPERQASRQPVPPDLCYVYNFADYRHLLRHAHGVPVAAARAAHQPAAVANGLWLLLALEPEWDLGTNQCGPGPAGTHPTRAQAATERRCDR
jgi:AAA domain